MATSRKNTPFADAVAAAGNANIVAQSRNSLDWYRKYCSSKLTGINTFNDVKNTGEAISMTKLRLGNIYTFMYSPKHKDTLPYYDSTPMIIPFKDLGSTFYAFNLHYLPYAQRAMAMDALFKISNSNRTGQQVLQDKYEVIMAMSKSSLFKPCVKQYLKSNVRSRFLEFKPEHWELAIFLPIASFKKMSESKVHKESMASVNKKYKRKK